jgi:hypothetical protein
LSVIAIESRIETHACKLQDISGRVWCDNFLIEDGIRRNGSDVLNITGVRDTHENSSNGLSSAVELHVHREICPDCCCPRRGHDFEDRSWLRFSHSRNEESAEKNREGYERKGTPRKHAGTQRTIVAIFMQYVVEG